MRSKGYDYTDDSVQAMSSRQNPLVIDKCASASRRIFAPEENF